MRKRFTNPICRYCKDDARKPNPPYQLAAGSILKGRYFIGRAIGQGGFGITYIGWDLNDSSRIAVKECFLQGVVIRDANVSSEVKTIDSETHNRFASQKERFLKEYKVLSGLSDIPGLVQIKDFFAENNTAYIVMEHIDGITLRKYVEKHDGKLSGKETFEILGPVMQSLAKVHGAKLVHRDISPDNLMVLENGGVKLLDFGTVREVNDCASDKPLTMATEAVIKRGYAPLEQYQSKGSLGPWTDVYAICATAFYCLTGKEPPEAIERLMQDKPVLLRANGADVSEREEGVLLQGLELRTHDRIQDMEKLYDALFHSGCNESMRNKNLPSDRVELFCICFLLELDETASDFLLKRLTGQGIHYRNTKELVYAYCLKNNLGYEHAMELVKEVMELDEGEYGTMLVYGCDGQTELLTGEVKTQFQVLCSHEELFRFIADRKSGLGNRHNTAYQYFNAMLGLLTKENGKVMYSLEKTADNYLRLNMPVEKRISSYSCIQKLVKKHWPGSRSIKGMKARTQDVTRKVLLLLYIVTGGVHHDIYEEIDEEDISAEDFLEFHCKNMNRMLNNCGMGRIDPRNAFDFLILYSIRPEQDTFMSERMAEIVEELYRDVL